MNELQHRIDKLEKKLDILINKINEWENKDKVCIDSNENEDVAYTKTERSALDRFKLFKQILHTEMEKIREQWTQFDYAASCEYDCGLYIVNYQMLERDSRKGALHCMSLQLSLDPNMMEEENIEYMQEIAQQLGTAADKFCYYD